MIRKIRKRDGKIADFNPIQITEAIWKAAQAVGGKDYRKSAELTNKVMDLLEKQTKRGQMPTVEQVQDAVEKTLIEEGHAKTAKAYILYRKQHQDIREMGGLLKDIDVVDGYLSMMDWKVKENSNMSYSLQGLNVYATENIISNYWLHKIFPPEIGDAHTNGQFHIHDLGTLGAYCVGWDLKDILLMGFKGVSGKIESKPAKHFGTALMQIVNYLYTLQGEAAGAQALSNFDSLLAPFINKDKLQYEAVKQEMQKFLFNMNVPTRVGFQSPFTNITMDLTVPSYMVDEPAIIGGDLIDNNFSDYVDEMNMINHAFAEIMHGGDAKGRPFTFPIPTYNITKDFDWNNDGLDPIWEMTAKYGVPYFSNFINSDMKPDDARSMCCRLRLDNRELRKRGGGLFGANPKTGSIGVVTINMPRIGYLAKNDDDFLERLDHLMVLAKQSLEIKREIIENLTDSGLHPYSRVYLADVKKTFGEYWKNHFSTIGLIGMNDALLNFMSKSIADKEGKAFAEKVLDYMRERMADFQQETGSIFNIEATPAEGTSYRLARIDHVQYPDIRTYNTEMYSNGNGGNGIEPYYTNSSQLPVGYTSDVFEALELQDSLQSKYTGGTVLHIFLGEEEPSPIATKKLVRKVAENYSLPYYTITPTFSICPIHGYMPGEHKYCPKCDEKIGYKGGN
jgi:anaerobic ribonucleoside-triphosphate reductase